MVENLSCLASKRLSANALANLGTGKSKSKDEMIIKNEQTNAPAALTARSVW